MTNTVRIPGLAKVALAFCVLALGGANAATIVFNVTGALGNGSVIGGTLTIDNTLGTVTAANITLTGPTTDTCTGVGMQSAIASPIGYNVALNCATGALLQLALISDAAGDLLGYMGGIINPNSANTYFSFYTTGMFSSNATGNLTLPAPPTTTKTFSPSTIQVGGTSMLTFTVTNPNAGPIAMISLTDTLTGGVQVASPQAVTFSPGCPSGTALGGIGPGVNTPTLSIPTIAANSSCSVGVNVTGTAAGVINNTTGPVASSVGTGAAGTATLTVVAAPVITKAFTDPVLQLLGPGSSTTLTFTITNPAGNSSTLNQIAFTDTLPSGLVVATPNGQTGSCGGGTITAVAGSGSIGLTGASLAAGASCTFSEMVTAAGVGIQVNTTSAVTAQAGMTTVTGNTATDTTTVNDLFFLWFFTESGGGTAH